MFDPIDKFAAHLDAAFTSVLTAAGVELETKLKAELATPYPPASRPGEKPHLRTANLQKGVAHHVETTHDGATLTMSSSRAEGDPMIPSWLEFGTFKILPRPFMRPNMNDAQQIMPLIIVAKFQLIR